MKKFILYLLIATLVIAYTPECNAQANTEENKKGYIIANVGAGFDFKQFNPIGLIINGGYEYRKIVALFAWQPNITTINPIAYVGIKAGYDFHNLIPMVGYYYMKSNNDDKIKNKFPGFGYSLKYNHLLGDQGGWFVEGVYLNKGFQLTAGFHVIFFDL